MRLDQTIVPWAILWLFYFEEWLISNEWKGGGLHPETTTMSQPILKETRPKAVRTNALSELSRRVLWARAVGRCQYRAAISP